MRQAAAQEHGRDRRHAHQQIRRPAPARALGGRQRHRAAVHGPGPGDPGRAARQGAARAARGDGRSEHARRGARHGRHGQLLGELRQGSHAALPGHARQQAAAAAAAPVQAREGGRADRARIGGRQRAGPLRQVLHHLDALPQGHPHAGSWQRHAHAARQGDGMHLARGHGGGQGRLPPGRRRGDGRAQAAGGGRRGWPDRQRRPNHRLHAPGPRAHLQDARRGVRALPAVRHARPAEERGYQA
mmetsp:Transcript_6081/g.24218  ORF Transcript_6081/g.24218 Transcript_6081/m.24218 type:complete len:244 (+) Transcript_6081:1280-2011(+)